MFYRDLSTHHNFYDKRRLSWMKLPWILSSVTSLVLILLPRTQTPSYTVYVTSVLYARYVSTTYQTCLFHTNPVPVFVVPFIRFSKHSSIHSKVSFSNLKLSRDAHTHWLLLENTFLCIISLTQVVNRCERAFEFESLSIDLLF